jgi:hypothetical protein
MKYTFDAAILARAGGASGEFVSEGWCTADDKLTPDCDFYQA